MALLQRRQGLLGQGLHHFDPLLDGKAGYPPQLDLSRLDLICQDVLEHPDCLFGDEGANAVSSYHPNYYRHKPAVVRPVLSCFHLINALELLIEQFSEVLLRPLYGPCMIHESHLIALGWGTYG